MERVCSGKLADKGDSIVTRLNLPYATPFLTRLLLEHDGASQIPWDYLTKSIKTPVLEIVGCFIGPFPVPEAFIPVAYLTVVFLIDVDAEADEDVFRIDGSWVVSQVYPPNFIVLSLARD